VNQMVTSEILKRSGFNCTIVSTGVEAVNEFLHNAFDLILMDVQMPEMDGLSAASEIRRIEAEKSLTRMPIIALTAHATTDDREHALAAGMDGFLTKPIMHDLLIAAINEYIKPAETMQKDKHPPGPGTLPRSASETGKTEKHSHTASSVPAIDLGVLLKVSDSDTDFVLKVFNEFESDSRPVMLELARTTAAGDLESLARLAHGLKGAAGTICAMPLRAAAEKLEMSAKAGNQDVLSTLVASVVSEFDRVSAAFDDFINQLTKL
jgi:CheY-like chemotaxis protein/HPt (histidine-containing phosphotransfer) domain-containing protein